MIGLAMLKIDHAYQLASAENRDGKESFKRVLRQILKPLEARILQGVRGNRHWLPVPAYPTCDSLPQADTEVINYIRVLILRCAQNQLIVFQYVHEARIAIDQPTGEIHDSIKNYVKRVGRRHPAAYLM